MSLVISKSQRKENSFIIYNHIFAKKTSVFTIRQLIGELKKYNMTISEAEIRSIIEEYVSLGLLHHHYRGYTL